jgi:hypothetical protein
MGARPSLAILLACSALFTQIACSGSGGSSSLASTPPTVTIGFTSSSKSWVGWCKKVTVGFSDSQGAAQSLAAAASFSITGNSSSVFSDSSCSTAITEVTAAAGATAVDVYIRPSAISISMGFTLNSATLGTATFAADSVRPTGSDSILGQSSVSTGTANGLGVSAGGLNDPRRMAIAGTKVLVADRANNRIAIYPSLTATAPSAVLGQPDLTTTTDNTPPSGGLFSDPVSVWTDGTKIVVTSKAQNRVMIWNNFPTGDGVAPDVIIGQSNDTNTTSGAGLNQLSSPEHAFITGTKLVVVDGGNSRILIFNSLPGATGTAADVTIGIGSGNAPDSFNTPTYACMVSNALLVADSANNRIQVFDSIPTASNASANLSLTLGHSAANPTSIATVGEKLLVYDENKSRTVFWNKLPTASSNPDGVIGQTDLSTVNTTIDNQTLGRGYGITVLDSELWIIDSERHRILKFETPGP